MYFDFRTYRRVFARALREPYQPRRRKITWALMLLFPVLALWDAVFFALDHVFFPGFRRVEIRTPVFIVGNARSGTTNIHRLLSGDERFSYFRTWQILLPSILQKEIVGAIARIDRRFFGGAIEARINGRQDRALAKARRMHDWRLDGAEEDGFLHLHTCGSGTISVIFPYNPMLEGLSNLDEKATPAERERQLRFYEGCVKRQIYFDGGDKILLSKNPAFVGRMQSLLERFPDLKFICPVRHPYETIPSLLNMLKKGWLAMGADPRDVDVAVEWLRRQGIETYLHAFEVLDAMPDDRYAIPTFGELVSAPRATVESIYERFGWEITPDYARFLDAQQARARAYQSGHRYDPGLGPPRETLHEELGPLFERFGWEMEKDGGD
jgi:hypothetical protein